MKVEMCVFLFVFGSLIDMRCLIGDVRQFFSEANLSRYGKFGDALSNFLGGMDLWWMGFDSVIIMEDVQTL